MSKYITWIGGVIMVGAIGVASLVASAAVGDPVFIRKAQVDPITLTTPNKTCLVGWLPTVWPSAVPGNFRGVKCVGLADDTVQCTARDDHTYTSAEYVVAEAAGTVRPALCVFSVGSADCKRKWGPTVLTVSQASALATCIENIWVGSDGDLPHELRVWRKTAGAGVYGSYSYHATAAAGDYLDLIIAELWVARTGTVE